MSQFALALEERDCCSRYREFARAHGRTPAEHLAATGGTGWVLWMMQRWTEWRQAHGVHRDAPITPEQHEAFDRWLRAWVDAATTNQLPTPTESVGKETR